MAEIYLRLGLAIAQGCGNGEVRLLSMPFLSLPRLSLVDLGTRKWRAESHNRETRLLKVTDYARASFQRLWNFWHYFNKRLVVKVSVVPAVSGSVRMGWVGPTQRTPLDQRTKLFQNQIPHADSQLTSIPLRLSQSVNTSDYRRGILWSRDLSSDIIDKFSARFRLRILW